MNKKVAFVLALALAIRCGVLLAGLRHGVNALRSADDYLSIANEWLKSGVFPPHALYFPPLYPLLCMAMIYFDAGGVGVLIAQICLGTASVYFVWLISLRIVNLERAALLACIIAAFDILLILHSSIILTETLYTFLLLGIICQMLYMDPDQKSHLMWLGVLIGLALLTRSVGLVLWPIIIVYWMLKKWPIAKLYLVCFIAFLLCLPSMFGNYRRYGRFQITASGKYNISALWIGAAKAQADGVNYGANLSMWGVGLNDGKSTFDQADAALPKSLAWAKEHSLMLLTAVVHGIGAESFGPAVSYYNNLIGWHSQWYDYMGAIYRGLLLLAAMVGLRRLWAHDYRSVVLLGGLLFVHMLAPGAAGYSRFAVPGEPLEIILAAIAIDQFWTVAARRRRKGEGDGIATVVAES